MMMTPLMEERVGSFITGSVVQTGTATGNLPQHTLAETTFLSLLGLIREGCEGLGLWGREVGKV